MFTLKLFKRMNGREFSRVVAVHHVQTMEIGANGKMVEVWAFRDQEPSPYDTYYIGEGEPDMNALNWGNHWGWGLLENEQGNTTQHYRPAGWGWGMTVTGDGDQTADKVAA